MTEVRTIVEAIFDRVDMGWRDRSSGRLPSDDELRRIVRAQEERAMPPRYPSALAKARGET